MLNGVQHRVNANTLTLDQGAAHESAQGGAGTLLTPEDTTDLSALPLSSCNELRLKLPINHFLSLLVQHSKCKPGNILCLAGFD